MKCYNINHVPPTEISEDLKEEFQEYIAKKNSARQEKANDKVKAAADKSVYCFAFDLQKVLDTPSAEADPLYYKRKLSVYNLNSDTKACKAFIRNETEGYKGANEISSCMLNYLRSLPSTVADVIMHSKILSWVRTKTWTWQLCCITLSSLLNTSVMTINQKYLESGTHADRRGFSPQC